MIPRIAAWTSALTLDAVPDAVAAVARSCLIDTIGVALAGSATDVAGIAHAVAFACGASGNSTVLGTASRLAAPAAAFANGAAAHALDFDDNCYAGVVHGSAVVLPAALAVAEAVDASGADLLTAFIAGSEAEYAVGAAATLSLYDRGWWTTGVLGPIGAAAAAARLLRLDAAATEAALGIAVAGAGGAKSAFGTDAKPLLAGRTAEAGVMAALLAASGASGPVDALEHARGFAALMNGGVLEREPIEALGRRWFLLDPGIDVKRIPVCLSSHAAVDAAADLVAEHRLDLDTISRIVTDVPPIVVANLAHRDPTTRQEAQFSMPFAVAALLVLGELRLEHLDEAVIRDPRIRAVMAVVEMVTGPRWDDAAARAATPEGAEVTIETRDGRTVSTFRDFARGSASRPLGSDQLDAKFRACAVPVIGKPAANSLLARLRRVDRLPKARDLLTGLPLTTSAKVST